MLQQRNYAKETPFTFLVPKCEERNQVKFCMAYLRRHLWECLLSKNRRSTKTTSAIQRDVILKHQSSLQTKSTKARVRDEKGGQAKVHIYFHYTRKIDLVDD